MRNQAIHTKVGWFWDVEMKINREGSNFEVEWKWRRLSESEGWVKVKNAKMQKCSLVRKYTAKVKLNCLEELITLENTTPSWEWTWTKMKVVTHSWKKNTRERKWR